MVPLWKAGKFADRYDIGQPIGAGGMGTVYAANDSVLGREVALKLLKPGVLERPDAKARFLREAKVAATLRHPHAIRVFDFGEYKGRPFIAMERIHGQNLGDKIMSEGRLSVALSTRIAYDVASVLSSAHDLRLIHRDIKPENILIEEPGGRTVVLDFGMAFVTDTDDADVGRLTVDGISGGTPAYMSPEQCGGRDVSIASDIYGLGCVLFECLVGRAPFVEEKHVNYFLRHLYDPAPRIAALRPKVPRALDELVARMLAKHPDDRPTAVSVRQRVAGLEAAGIGSRERSRDASYLSNRAARAIPRDTPFIPKRDSNPLRMLIIGITDDEIRLGLRSTGIVAEYGGVDQLGGHDVVFVAEAENQEIADVVLNSGTTPVLAGRSNAGIDDIQVLLRIGVAEIVARPRNIAELATKARRAHKRRSKGTE